ncbi:MAG: 50S ribosomal protein L30, partial [Flavobacteriaceae bacterium]
MAKIKVTQVKSQIGRLKNQKRTLEALGLRKMNQTVVHEATPSIVGMVNTIKH